MKGSILQAVELGFALGMSLFLAIVLLSGGRIWTEDELQEMICERAICPTPTPGDG